jgi:hypothetical protein
MHGSPPCTITVARFAAWRVAVAAVALAVLASLAAWLVGSPLGASAWVRAGVAAAALASLGLAASLWRQRPVRLRWDGFVWTMAPAFDLAAERPGRLEVAIDLGSFLLLRFLPAAGARPAAVRWIPVGRAGLERDWHAFRCAVHSPVSAGAATASEPRRP